MVRIGTKHIVNNSEQINISMVNIIGDINHIIINYHWFKFDQSLIHQKVDLDKIHNNYHNKNNTGNNNNYFSDVIKEDYYNNTELE